MNEHDSERIAGLLEADGFVRADSEDDADVVVLNTCCIRENADNKLYGNLGHLKAWKGERTVARSWCRDAWPRRTGRSCATGAVRRRRARHAQRPPHRRARRARPSGRRADHRDLRRGRRSTITRCSRRRCPPGARRSYNAWVTIQIGCDNSCAFCIVPAVRGAEISRPFDDVVAEVERSPREGVTEVTLLGQNVNSYGRDLQLAARNAGDDVARVRPLFADLLRVVGAVDGIRRVRFTSPHPKDMRPETFAAMAETAAVCEHLHYPLQSGSDRVLAAMHRGYTAERYLERLAEARRAVPDLAVSTDIIVGFPGETDDDFERTLEVVAAAEYDYAYTFIFSPATGHRGGRRWRTRSSIRSWRGSASRGSASSSSARRWPSTRPGSARVEEVLVEGPSKRDPDGHVGPDPPEQARPLPSRRRCARAATRSVEITRAAPHHLHGSFVELVAEPSHKMRHPRSMARCARCRRLGPPVRLAALAVSAARRTRRHPCDPVAEASVTRRTRGVRRGRAGRVAIVGSTASGKSAVAMAVAARSRRRRSGVGRRDAGVPRHGHRHRQADAGRAGRGPHHCIDLVDPDAEFTVAEFKAAPPRRWTTSAERGGHALLVAGTGLYHRVVIDDFDLPGRVARRSAPSSTTTRRRRPPSTAGSPRSIRSAAAKMEPTNRRRVVRALEVMRRQRATVQLVRPGRRRLSRRAPWCRSACVGRAPCCPSASSGGCSDDRRRPRRRGAARSLTAPDSRAPRARRSATRRCSSTWTGADQSG